VVNYIGVRPGSSLQTSLTVAKVVAIGGLLALLFGTPDLRVPNATSAIEADNFLRALVAGLFAFGGWHMVTYAADETRDPRRIIPRALMIGTAVVVVIYLALNAAYLLVLPLDRVLASTRIAYDATMATAGPGWASAIAVLVIVSTLGAVSGIILAGPRVYLAMAADGLLFEWMGAVHTRYRTPHLALAAQAVWSSVLVWTGSYGTIVSRVIYTEWIFFGALAIGAMRARRRPTYAASFHAVGFPMLPIVFAAVCAAIVVNQIVSDPRNSVIGLALVAAGLPVYFLWSRRHARHRLS
jgi:APA family basic amino acid/polyamine antiporter